MSFLSTQAARLQKLARYLEAPHLFAIRRRGVNMDIYHKLTQPWLQARNFRTILDIGANVGQFALAASAAFPKAQLYSFEPLPDCFKELNAKLAGQANFKAFNIGLGSEAGTVSFERNDFTASSSFLKMADVHKQEFPATLQTKSVTVKVERLDDVASNLDLKHPMLVKLDVQGFEEKVLQGGEQTIKGAGVLVIESSFEALYEGQPLFDQIYQRLLNWGFSYAGSLDQIYSPKDGRPLQADSIFVRRANNT